MPQFPVTSSPELGIIAAERQSTCSLGRTRTYTHGLTLSALASCAYVTRFSLFTVCLLAIYVWQKMSLRWWAAATSKLQSWQSPRVGCSPVLMPLCIPIPGNPCREETKNSLLLAQHAIGLVPWYKFKCGCVDVLGFHCLDRGSVVPPMHTISWYQHPPVTRQSSLLSQLFYWNPSVPRIACAFWQWWED